MNRFEEALRVLRECGEVDEKLQKILPELEALETVVGGDRNGLSLRLPYSSDPRPLEDAWASN